MYACIHVHIYMHICMLHICIPPPSSSSQHPFPRLLFSCRRPPCAFIDGSMCVVKGGKPTAGREANHVFGAGRSFDPRNRPTAHPVNTLGHTSPKESQVTGTPGSEVLAVCSKKKFEKHRPPRDHAPHLTALCVSISRIAVLSLARG